MRNQNGLTLVEIIVVFVLMGIMAGLGATLLGTALQGYTISNSSSEAAAELKTSLDLISTRMSDIMEIECFSEDQEIRFLNTNGNATTVKVNPLTDTVNIFNWDILENADNLQLDMNLVAGTSLVRNITLSFDYNKPNAVLGTYNLVFSPRTIIDKDSHGDDDLPIPSCTP